MQTAYLKNKSGSMRTVKQLKNGVLVNGKPILALTFDEVISTLMGEGFEVGGDQ